MIVRTVNLTGIYAGNVRNIVAGYLRSVSNGYQSAVCSGAPSSFYDNSVCTNYGDALYNPMWTILVVAGGASMLALLVMFILALWVLSREQGNAEMRAIAKAIQIGAGAFLHREYAYLSAFVFVVTILLVLFLDWTTAICFICGASMSALTGYWGMWIAVRANVRTTEAATKGLNSALRVAFYAGSVMGLSVVGVGLLSITVLLVATANVTALAGFGFGASSIALFARVGGGIFTKAADVGADLVGKVEAGIPEDDPRNPAVIADNVGDNVGDVAGMGADLFESYVSSIIATATLALETGLGWDAVVLPFVLAGCGIVCAIVGAFCVYTKEGASQNMLLMAMRGGTLVASVLVLIASAICVFLLDAGLPVFGCIVLGLVAGILIGASTEYFTSFAYSPTQTIANAGRTGPATVIIQGLATGMHSCTPPTVILAVVIFVCVSWAGVYGVAIAAVGMLSTLGVTLATDAYGPVADNAGGIAEMAELHPSVRERTDALDALGNTTAATGKGFAIGSAVLTALALMTAYAKAVNITSVDVIANPVIVPGILIGAVLPFVFGALTMTAVGRSAMAIIEEVRRQFRDIPGLLEGSATADYATCVAISTEASLREMIAPGVLAVLSPIFMGLILGPAALAGMLGGSIALGFLLAVTMANAGGAWDNSKKYVEAGNLGGKGTALHASVVVGDTVGDPFKDTSGPALNILLKLMSIVALVFAPIFAESTLFGVPRAVVGILLLVGLLLIVGIGWLCYILWNRRKSAAADRDAASSKEAETAAERKMRELQDEFHIERAHRLISD